MSKFANIIGIIVSPTKTLEAIRIKPTIILPMIIAIILPLLYLGLFWSNLEVEMIKQIEQQLAATNVEVTPALMDVQIKLVRLLVPIGGVVGVVAGGLFTALYYFVCAKIVKSEATYKQLLSVIYHVLIIGSLSAVLNIVLTLIGIDINMQMPITSLASLLPESLSGSFIYGASLTVEVFSIWSLVVIYIGLRVVADMSKKAALISVFLNFVFGILYAGGSLALASFLGR